MAGNATGKITNETEVGTTELAVVLGLTGRRVQQMAQDGTITPIRRGRFLLGESIRRYINFLSAKNKDNSKQEIEKQNAEIRIKNAKAVIAELEAKELQGKMHRSEDVAAMTEDLIYSIRTMLVALPGRLAVDVASTESSAEAAEVIRKEVFKVMQELSNYCYDPDKYEERVRERRNWEINDGCDVDDE